ncbi:MAG: ATP-binding protein [Gemmatimonadaceae bacterium]|nr:ATP-binding protein [Gemmatimonadaceae bacterium]
MTTFHLLLADAGVLLAVLSALLAASAWGVATWDASLRDALTFFARGWGALAVALLTAALSVPATFADAMAWRVTLVGASNVAFLWNAAFTYGAIRRVVGLGRFPLGRLSAWLTGYTVAGVGSALLMLSPATTALDALTRLAVFGWCAGLYLQAAWAVTRQGAWRDPAHTLLAAGSLGCALGLGSLSALLPAFAPGATPPDGGLWLPILALVAFVALALGVALYVVRERRALDLAAAATLAEERHRASTSAASLDAAMGAIGDGAVQLDLALNLKAWNPTFEQLAAALGVRPVVGAPCGAMMTDETRPLWEQAWRAIAAGRPAQFRMVRRFGDERRTIDVRAAPTVQDGAVIGGVAVLRDITEVVELEARFHHAQRSEAVGRLAHGVAHDFNNLLSALSMTLELADDDPDPATALRDIRTIADRGRDLTRHLLDMARRRPEGEPEQFLLRERIFGLASVLGRILGGQVVLEIDDIDPSLVVRMGAGHFDQVLLNLVVNARDAMPAGGTIRLSAERAWRGTQRMVEWRVTDTGAGMSPDVLARALEPYFTTKAAGTGTGLGLSTCRDLVAQAGGELLIDSAPGRGTTVAIRLPVPGLGSASMADGPMVEGRTAEAGAGVPATDAAAPVRRVSPAPGALAIIADDDPLVLRSIDRVLQRQGFRTIPCADGAEALDALRAAGAVRLIVSDVLMPRLDGPSWVQTARAEGCDARVLFVSGYDGERVDAGVLARLDAGFLAKPFTTAQLAEAVDPGPRPSVTGTA